ncbi:Thymidylate kinase [Thermoplasmatales archaeon BRNA1]|nr:Thymidylate kinase [Thermoplasmatales archaeon BRNA1]
MAWYVVDGMDGSGKSTAAEMLREELESRGRKVFLVTHPNVSCVVGRMEAKFLTIEGKPAMMLSTMCYIADVLRSLTIMRARLRKYDDFVFVRYIMGVAYLPESKVPKVYRMVERILPMPDTKYLIDVDPDTALSRIDTRGEEKEVFETRDKLEETRRKMMSVSDGWIIVDNTKDMEDTRRQIRSGLEGAC